MKAYFLLFIFATGPNAVEQQVIVQVPNEPTCHSIKYMHEGVVLNWVFTDETTYTERKLLDTKCIIRDL